MNIVVLGAGAVGGYFGAKLATANVPVTFLVRERRYTQLQQEGLQIHSVHGDFTITPEVCVSTDGIENPDVVLIALKNYHLDAAMPQIRELVDKGAILLPLLNGVQHFERLITEFGTSNVLGGTCYIEATLSEQGHVLHTSPMHDIIYGPLSSNNARIAEVLAQLAEALDKAQIPAKQSDHVMKDIWTKFSFLTAFSGITAATRQPIGAVLQDDAAYNFLQDVVKEIVTVARTQLASLPLETFDHVMDRFTKVSPQMTSSLHRDLEKGLPLEIDSLQGAIQEIAATAGVAVPSVRAIYALLHPYKNGSTN